MGGLALRVRILGDPRARRSRATTEIVLRVISEMRPRSLVAWADGRAGARPSRKGRRRFFGCTRDGPECRWRRTRALVGGGAAEDDAAEGVAGEGLVAQVGDAEGDAVGVADAELFAVGLELDVPVVGEGAAAVEDDEVFVVVDVGDGAGPLDDFAAEEPGETLLRERDAVGAAVDDGFGMEVIGGAGGCRCGRGRGG